MQPHRTAPWPDGIARAGTVRHEIQRVLLLELCVDAPADGEPLARLAARLGYTRAAIAGAASALQRAGVAERGPGGLRASAPARAVEALLPLRL